jgi:hypothetical protein
MVRDAPDFKSGLTTNGTVIPNPKPKTLNFSLPLAFLPVLLLFSNKLFLNRFWSNTFIFQVFNVFKPSSYVLQISGRVRV